MLDSLYVPVPSFISLMILGGIFLVVVYIDSRSKIVETPPLQYDQELMSRMNELGIVSLVSLQQKSGLTYLQMHQVRSGELGLLKLKELTRLAKNLDWTIEELLGKFGIANISSSKSLSDSETLLNECLQLREALQNQSMELTSESNYSSFQQLQTLLTNYPSIQQLVEVKPNVPAKNLTSLFTPLDNLIESWGYEKIGQVWEQVAYNPQFHQPDASDIEAGEMVYIRFVGYRDGEKILCPAKVSRTLPAVIQS